MKAQQMNNSGVEKLRAQGMYIQIDTKRSDSMKDIMYVTGISKSLIKRGNKSITHICLGPLVGYKIDFSESATKEAERKRLICLQTSI